MKKYIFFFYIIPFLYGCNSVSNPKIHDSNTQREVNQFLSFKEKSYNDYLSRIDTIILGDINFDSVIDTAIVYPVQFKDPEDIMMGCLSELPSTKIYFTHDDSWLYQETAIELIRFYVLDDINEDGVKEIALIPGWYQSCWSEFFVYSNHNGIWKNISWTSVWSCGDLDYKVIKLKKNKFNVPDRIYSVIAEDMIDTVKTVIFPKYIPN